MSVILTAPPRRVAPAWEVRGSGIHYEIMVSLVARDLSPSAQRVLHAALDTEGLSLAAHHRTLREAIVGTDVRPQPVPGLARWLDHIVDGTMRVSHDFDGIARADRDTALVASLVLDAGALDRELHPSTPPLRDIVTAHAMETTHALLQEAFARARTGGAWVPEDDREAARVLHVAEALANPTWRPTDDAAVSVTRAGRLIALSMAGLPRGMADFCIEPLVEHSDVFAADEANERAAAWCLLRTASDDAQHANL
jgi:hypothetical protein